MNPDPFRLSISRRTFLGQSAFGLGGIALGALLNPVLRAASEGAVEGRWRGVIE